MKTKDIRFKKSETGSKLRTVFMPAIMALLAIMILTQSGQAIGISFNEQIDSTMLIPEGTGTFTALQQPAISLGNIAFMGTGAGQQGVYSMTPNVPCFPPNPIRIADLGASIPEGTGTFTELFHPVISGMNIAFVGTGAGQQGVYSMFPSDRCLPPSPVRIADLSTLIPGGSGSFTSFSSIPDIDGADVALIGYGSEGQSGVYALLDGALTAIADSNTPIPGGAGSFVFWPVGPIRILQQNVVFIADGVRGQEGIYLSGGSPRTLTKVADSQTQIPDTEQFFDAFTTVSYDGTQVVFTASSASVDLPLAGVYKVLTPEVPPITPPNPIKIADTGTLAPGGIGNFLGFGNAVTDPGVVVFEGTSSDGNSGTINGIYTDLGGTLSKIIAEGDTLNGRKVTHLEFGPGGFSDNQAIFAATFEDGSQVINTASLCTALEFAGFHSPIGGADAAGGSFADPLGAFKLKSTIPVKMTLNCGGSPVTSGIHTIQVIKFDSSTTSDTPVDATPTDAATIGNAFRLTNSTTGEWHFNLNTKDQGMGRGIWQIKAALSDGSIHTAFIELK